MAEHKTRMVRTEPTGYIDVTARFYREDGQWVAACGDLGVATCGDTFEEAISALGEALELYLNTLESEGELERVFREHNITFHEGPPPPDTEVGPVTAHFNEFVTRQRIPVPA